MPQLINEKVIFCTKCVESNQRYVSSVQHKDEKKLIRQEHLLVKIIIYVQRNYFERKKKLIGN